MKPEIIVKGKATKETFMAIDSYTKSNDISILERIATVVRKGSKIVLL